jgi:hypothetical protein
MVAEIVILEWHELRNIPCHDLFIIGKVLHNVKVPLENCHCWSRSMGDIEVDTIHHKVAHWWSCFVREKEIDVLFDAGACPYGIAELAGCLRKLACPSVCAQSLSPPLRHCQGSLLRPISAPESTVDLIEGDNEADAIEGFHRNSKLKWPAVQFS